MTLKHSGLYDAPSQWQSEHQTSLPGQRAYASGWIQRVPLIPDGLHPAFNSVLADRWL